MERRAAGMAGGTGDKWRKNSYTGQTESAKFSEIMKSVEF